MITIFRALRSRNYQLFFAGQGISVIGTWMQQVALSWYVYRITGSSFALGLIAFLNQIPTLILTPFGGVIADHFERRRTLILTQASAMVQALLLGILVLSGSKEFAFIAVLGLFLGIVNSVDAPVRQSFVVEMVDRREDLTNAIALNSALFNGARLIGPAIAGVLIAALGEGLCFIINGASYAAVIAALFLMKVRPRPRTGKNVKVLSHLKEGLMYAYRTAPIRYALVILAVFSLFGFSYVVLLPVIVREILKGDAKILGFIMGGAGVGALIGSLILASRKTTDGLWTLISAAGLAASVSLLVLAFVSHFWPVFLLVLLIGFCMILLMGSINTYIQHTVLESKRGLVMSLYTMAFMGMAPIGSLVTGSVAHAFSIRTSLTVNGLICLAVFAVISVLNRTRKTVKRNAD